MTSAENMYFSESVGYRRNTQLLAGDVKYEISTDCIRVSNVVPLCNDKPFIGYIMGQ